ncbi:MAG: replicative DNA helicase [Actinomycetia bacterium]|nr:replicative DNA helicase [Actinomycetes bacterium]
MSVELDRLPPQHLEAELAVLGALLIDPGVADDVAQLLKPEDFYRDAHREVYEAILDLLGGSTGHQIDVITVSEALRRRGTLDNVGGLPFLMELAKVVPTAAHAVHYAQIVREKAILRRVIETGTKMVGMAFAGERSSEEILEQAQQALSELAHKGRREPQRLQQILVTTLDRVEKMASQKGLAGLSTGFPDFDRLTSGLQPSDFLVVAARPSMGKTNFCLNIARHVAVRERVPVVIFSLEMSQEQLALRLIAAEADIDGQRLRTGNLTEEMWARLTQSLGRLGDAPIYIDDTPALSPLELAAKARALNRKTRLGLIIVDYLQLMTARGRAENRQQEISEISRSLKALARELAVPVLTLSQLSRAVESRTDKRPMLSDLRESGAIEQDADLVAFIYRDDYYSKETETQSPAELIIAKQRNGPTGLVHLLFRKDTGKFLSVAPE